MNVSGDLTDRKGILNIVITDTYDFKYETLSKNAQLKDIFINYSNNLAYCHQKMDISIYMILELNLSTK